MTLGMSQNDFDLMIGRLDRILSQMVWQGRLAGGENRTMYGQEYDHINRQTLKHHAEDMVLAGRKILKDLNEEEPK